MTILKRLLALSLRTKIVVLVILLIAGWVFIPKLFAGKTQQPTYQTATAEKGNIISTISESGNVTSASQVNISSPANGVLEEVYVQNGETVEAGQNLFKVRATATPAEKASAYSNYLAAQNGLNNAQSKLNSLQSALFKANQAFVNGKGVNNPSDQQKSDPIYIEQQAEWQQAEADYKNQQGVINQAQAALTSASLAYQATQDSIVTAPIGGTIANLSAAVGSSVTAGSSNSGNSTNSSSTTTSTGSPVLVIGNFSDLMIKTSVNEIDISKIKPGQKVTITLDAFPDKTFVGTVVNADTIGVASSGVVTYNVYITFIAPPSDIRPGMTASVAIQTERRDDVVKIPSSAIQTSNGESTVRVMKNGKVTQVPVETGISSDTDTEIISGISEGDTVVTSINTSTSRSGNNQTTSPFSSLGGGRGFGGGGRNGGGGGNAVFIRRGN